MALLEVVGEISKGLTDKIANGKWYENPTRENIQENLDMCLRGAEVAEAILVEGEYLVDHFHGQIDKYSRQMVNHMNGSLGRIKSHCVEFQMLLAKLS